MSFVDSSPFVKLDLEWKALGQFPNNTHSHCQESAGKVAASWMGVSSDVTSSFGFKNFRFGALGNGAMGIDGDQTGSQIRQTLG